MSRRDDSCIARAFLRKKKEWMGLGGEARRCCFSMIPFGLGANVQPLYHTMILNLFWRKWRKPGVFDN